MLILWNAFAVMHIKFPTLGKPQLGNYAELNIGTYSRAKRLPSAPSPQIESLSALLSPKDTNSRLYAEVCKVSLV